MQTLSGSPLPFGCPCVVRRPPATSAAIGGRPRGGVYEITAGSPLRGVLLRSGLQTLPFRRTTAHGHYPTPAPCRSHRRRAPGRGPALELGLLPTHSCGQRPAA